LTFLMPWSVQFTRTTYLDIYPPPSQPASRKPGGPTLSSAPMMPLGETLRIRRELIHRSAWKMNSANFACCVFSEVTSHLFI
jgi:hypothetical protein